MNKYLIAISPFPKPTGFCHRTILLSAKSDIDAYDFARHHHPIGYLNIIIKNDKRVDI
jgi:hypothetical protein